MQFQELSVQQGINPNETELIPVSPSKDDKDINPVAVLESQLKWAQSQIMHHQEQLKYAQQQLLDTQAQNAKFENELKIWQQKTDEQQIIINELRNAADINKDSKKRKVDQLYSEPYAEQDLVVPVQTVVHTPPTTLLIDADGSPVTDTPKKRNKPVRNALKAASRRIRFKEMDVEQTVDILWANPTYREAIEQWGRSKAWLTSECFKIQQRWQEQKKKEAEKALEQATAEPLKNENDSSAQFGNVGDVSSVDIKMEDIPQPPPGVPPLQIQPAQHGITEVNLGQDVAQTGTPEISQSLEAIVDEE